MSSRLSSAVVTQGLHVALANQYSFVSLLTRQRMMLFLTGRFGLMVASKLSRLVTGRASRLASDVCRSAAFLKMQGGVVITITSDASDELPPLLRVQFYAGFLPALGDLLYSHPLAITTSNHPPTTDTKHLRPETYCLDREAAHVCPPQAAWRHQEWVRETHPAQAPAVPVKRSPVHPKARSHSEHIAAPLDTVLRPHAALGDRGRRQIRAKGALVAR